MTINSIARRLALPASLLCLLSSSAFADDKPRFESLVTPCTEEMPVEAQVADANECSNLQLTPGNACDQLARTSAMTQSDPIENTIHWSFAYYFNDPLLQTPVESDEHWLIPALLFPTDSNFINPVPMVQLFSTASVW